MCLSFFYDIVQFSWSWKLNHYTIFVIPAMEDNKGGSDVLQRPFV